MFINSRVTVVTLGLLSAVSFPAIFSVSQAFADTQPHSAPAGSHAAPVKHHSITSASISHVGSFVQTTKASKAHSAVMVSTLTSDSISSVSKKHLAEEKAAEFRNHYTTILANCPIGTNSHGGCTGAGVYHQGADALLLHGLGIAGSAVGGYFGGKIGAGIGGGLGEAASEIIQHSVPSISALHQAENHLIDGSISLIPKQIPTYIEPQQFPGMTIHSQPGEVAFMVIPGNNTSYQKNNQYNNLSGVPSRKITKSIQQNASSSKVQEVSSGSVVEQTTSHSVAPTVSLLG